MALFICTDVKTKASGDCDNLIRGGRCDFVEGMTCPFVKKASGSDLEKVELSLRQELQYCHTVGRTIKLREKGKVVVVLRPELGSSWREVVDDPYGLGLGKKHLEFEVVDMLVKNSWDLEGMQRLSPPSSWEENP
jgi:hypothetical protein